MTVQELCDKLTTLCHEGYAQAEVKHISGELVKTVNGVEKVGEDSVVIISTKVPEVEFNAD